MPNMGGMEWVILLVVALLLFGGSRLAGMGKGAGRAIREFKEEIKPDPPAVEPGKRTTVEDETAVTDPVVQAELRKDV